MIRLDNEYIIHTRPELLVDLKKETLDNGSVDIDREDEVSSIMRIHVPSVFAPL